MSFLLNCMVYLPLVLGLQVSADETVDSRYGTIKKIDLSDDGPKPGPNHVVIVMDMKKLGISGARGNVVLYQFPTRVRIEFEGAGLPKGKYTLAVAANCAAGAYASAWTELHQFISSSALIATEKSLPKATLRDAKAPGVLGLTGKSLALFRVIGQKYSQVDCKPVI